MPIALHDIGHIKDRSGRLLRADRENGRWVATRYSLDWTVHDLFHGTDAQVHDMIEHWRRHG